MTSSRRPRPRYDATVEAPMDLGVDGIITNHPDRVRTLMAQRGMRLPKAYPAP